MTRVNLLEKYKGCVHIQELTLNNNGYCDIDEKPAIAVGVGLFDFVDSNETEDLTKKHTAWRMMNRDIESNSDNPVVLDALRHVVRNILRSESFYNFIGSLLDSYHIHSLVNAELLKPSFNENDKTRYVLKNAYAIKYLMNKKLSAEDTIQNINVVLDGLLMETQEKLVLTNTVDNAQMYFEYYQTHKTVSAPNRIIVTPFGSNYIINDLKSNTDFLKIDSNY